MGIRQRVLPMFILAAIIVISVSANAAQNQVLLRHGGVVVTEEDVTRYVTSRVPANEVANAIGRDGAVMQIIENIHTLRAIAAQADELGLDMDQLAWEAELNRIRLLSDAVMQQRVDNAFANRNWDDAAREEYIANPTNFMSNERAAASHILISTQNRSDEDARQLAEQIRERLLEGEKFSDLAKEYSDDPTVMKNSGSLGVFGRGKMVPEFESALFALREDGALADITRTPFGYHVIRLNKYYPSAKQPFERVKSGIIESIKKRVAQETRAAETNKIKNVSAKEVFSAEEAINKLQEKFKSVPKE